MGFLFAIGIVGIIVLVAIIAVLIMVLPDIRRYLKMRSM
ncbi:MAG: DUF6893 family small protein [Pyrinomonadaceae bacterium]